MPMTPETHARINDLYAQADRMENYDAEVYDDTYGDGAGDGLRGRAAELRAEADQLARDAGIDPDADNL